MNILLLLTAIWTASAQAAPGTAPTTSWFSVVKEQGRYWLVAPAAVLPQAGLKNPVDGRRFYSMGVDVVRPDDSSPDKASAVYHGGIKRGGTEAWGAFTADRLRSAGFNTIGAWSDPIMERQGLPYCVVLTLGVGATHRLADLWDPGYARRVAAAARAQISAHYTKDQLLIGYFLDNELPWYGAAGWPTGSGSLLETYLALPAKAPGRQVAREFLANRARESAYTNIQRRQGAWEHQLAEEPDVASAFAGKVAGRFMQLAVKAVRSVDAHHLILGVRFAGDAPAPVIHAVGAAADVISVDYYIKSGRPELQDVDRLFLLSGKPVLVTEFSWRAMENRSGNKNTKGADVTVATQADRARRYTRSVERLAAMPQVVGFHWFQYFDQPPGGRFDGEDSNYGIVDLDDEPYGELWSAMQTMNTRIAALHADSSLLLPVALGESRPDAPLPVLGADLRPELGRHPFPAFTYVAYPGGGVTGAIWGDPASQCQATFEERTDAGIFRYSLNGGWGCGVALALKAGKTPIDAAGSTRCTAALSAPRGVRFRVVFMEDGVGPRDAVSFKGARGADGEQYISAECTGSGTIATYALPLNALRVSPGFGNPVGNEQLDAQALAGIGLHVTGGTPGPGEIVIHHLALE